MGFKLGTFEMAVFVRAKCRLGVVQDRWNLLAFPDLKPGEDPATCYVALNKQL
jgi:hypothetical protein